MQRVDGRWMSNLAEITSDMSGDLSYSQIFQKFVLAASQLYCSLGSYTGFEGLGPDVLATCVALAILKRFYFYRQSEYAVLKMKAIEFLSKELDKVSRKHELEGLLANDVYIADAHIKK
jgi:hypothetical protein